MDRLRAELAQQRAFVLQLQGGVADELSFIDLCRSLFPKMMCSVERSIAFADGMDSSPPLPLPAIDVGGGESPRSASQSPRRSEDSTPTVFGHKEMSKKRKKEWTKKVRVGGGIGGPQEDGYSWRKYGQKDILGAKNPRGYFRCSHRHTRGCPATKQVQRSDSDPLAFDLTYHGTHTCLQQPSLSLPSPPPQELLTFQPDIKVKPELLATSGVEEENTSFSFSFGSMPVTQHISPSTCTSENGFSSASPCSTFFSPAEAMSEAMSESSLNYVPVMSPCMVSSGFEGLHGLHTSESDLTDIMSANNSATGSPAIDLGLLESLNFLDFHFDSPSFFL